MKLPDLIKLENYNGSWEDYIEVVYQVFRRDFIENKTFYNNKRVGVKKTPLFKNKECCFWHLTSQGKVEEERIPDLRRCERIGWIKPIIENNKNKLVKFWINQRQREERICLCYGDWDYLIVLIKIKDYLLLLTAYPIEYNSKKDKLKKEYYAYKENIAH